MIHRHSIGVITGIAATGLSIAGCSQAGYGESVSVPPEQRASLASGFAKGARISVPSDAEFNLHETQRGSDGTGQAKSSAGSNGTASCTAASNGEGSAHAEFQLGYVLDNRGAEALDVNVQFNVDYKWAMRSSASYVSTEADFLGLRVYIRDSNQKTLRELSMAHIAPFSGPTQRSVVESQVFDLSMEPGLSYYLVLAGRTAVGGGAESPVQSEIQVNSLSIELTPR